MAFPSYFLDQVKNHIGLAQFIGRRIRLQKKGREYLGLCPFHKEKTPSFTVNEDKGFFHCFGCGEHGSIFDFVMRIENLTFPETVERLAMEAGIDLPVETPEEITRNKFSQLQYGLLENACQYYERQLFLPSGETALNYLLDRGIGREAISKFRLGFSGSNSGGLKNELFQGEFSRESMVQAGLLIQPETVGRKPYERFRNRAMFPITDLRGRVIAFGGRILGEGEPKYLNSPETALFRKGRNLYGLQQAASAVREKGELIVTEGYTDVIALHQSGINTAVAPLGTALTDEQIQLLWRFSREPLLCFDGDAAGERAAVRAAERALPFLKPGYSLKFSILPAGSDPDSIIGSKGSEAMREVFSNSIELSDILWHLETTSYKLETPEERSWLESRLNARAMSIEDQTVRRYYLNHFRERLWQRFRKTRSNLNDGRKYQVQDNNQLAEKSGINAQVNAKVLGEAILIYTLISHPLLFEHVGELLGTIAFSDEDLDKLRQEVLKTLASLEASGIELETQILEKQLDDTECAVLMRGSLRRQVSDHAGFSRPDEDIKVARFGWEQQFRILMRGQLLAEIEATKERLKKDLNHKDLELLKTLKQSAMEMEDTDGPLVEVEEDSKSTGTIG